MYTPTNCLRYALHGMIKHDRHALIDRLSVILTPEQIDALFNGIVTEINVINTKKFAQMLQIDDDCTVTVENVKITYVDACQPTKWLINFVTIEYTVTNGDAIKKDNCTYDLCTILYRQDVFDVTVK